MAVIAGAFAFTACEEDIDLGVAKLSIDPLELTFGPEGASKSVTMVATRDWLISGDLPEWIAVSPTSGQADTKEQTITVTVLENKGNDRETTVNFTIGMVKAALNVKQTGEKGEYVTPTISCAEFIQKADPNTEYRLVGKVSSSVNTQYCSFDLNDGTATVVVWTVNNKDEWVSVVKQGGTVTVRGKYMLYTGANGQTKHEMVDAYIEAFEPAEAEDPSKVQQITCAEFIQKADPNTTYRLVGKVDSAVNTQYCSFDLNDGTATVVVWTVNNKDEWSSVVKQGGTVTVRGKYLLYTGANGQTKHEMVDAYIEAFSAGESQPEDTPTGNGTLESPYNPKAAYDVAAALESGAKTENDVYIKGKISSVKYTFSAQYGTATFNISENGTTSGTQLPIYSVLYLGNKAWVDGDTQIAVGDEVIICGKLTNYQGNTPETASKEAYIYSLNGQTSIAQSDVFGVEKKDIRVAASATSAEIKVTGNVAWTVSRKSDQVTCNPTSGEGAGTITVSFAANESTETEVSYSIGLSTDADVAEKLIVVNITQAKASQAGEKAVKIETNNTLSWSTVTDDTYKEGRSVTVEGVTISCFKNTSTTGFDNFLQSNHIRIFKNYVLKIDAGATITKVVLNCAYSDKCFEFTVSDGSKGTADTSVPSVTWEGSINPFIAEMTGGQNRVASIEVYYQ